MARGYQGDKGDVKALAMKKWFNTNYHYMVPEIDDTTSIHLAAQAPLKSFFGWHPTTRRKDRTQLKRNTN